MSVVRTQSLPAVARRLHGQLQRKRGPVPDAVARRAEWSCHDSIFLYSNEQGHNPLDPPAQRTTRLCIRFARGISCQRGVADKRVGRLQWTDRRAPLSKLTHIRPPGGFAKFFSRMAKKRSTKWLMETEPRLEEGRGGDTGCLGSQNANAQMRERESRLPEKLPLG